MDVLAAYQIYRMVQSPDLPLDNFMSDEMLGEPPPENPAKRRMWQGVSCWATLAETKKKTRMAGRLPYIAVLEFTDDCGVECEQTGHNALHRTIWGEPERLKALVIRVESFYE